MTDKQADRFVRAASLLFVLQGKISSKKANFRLRQATAPDHGRRKTSSSK